MTEVEKQVLLDRFNALTVDEKRLALSTIDFEMLVLEIRTRYNKMKVFCNGIKNLGDISDVFQ